MKYCTFSALILQVLCLLSQKRNDVTPPMHSHLQLVTKHRLVMHPSSPVKVYMVPFSRRLLKFSNVPRLSSCASYLDAQGQVKFESLLPKNFGEVGVGLVTKITRSCLGQDLWHLVGFRLKNNCWDVISPSQHFLLSYNTSCYVICSSRPKQRLMALYYRFITPAHIFPCCQVVNLSSGQERV